MAETASPSPIDASPSPAGRDAYTAAPLDSTFKLAFQWQDLTYKVDDKEILSSLSGVAMPSRTLAVMGSSGAGKTVFLKALCNEIPMDKTHVLSGQRTLNGVGYRNSMRRLVGYVTQEDVVFPTATPTDAFRFSLRVRRGLDYEPAMDKVNDMIAELHLDRAKDTQFGIPGLVSGLSGGEKRRTSIGIELISDPKIVLLDEPTSGLDSVTATTVIAHLREVARKGRTVIFSIHQPTADTLQYFDDLLLLAHGKAVYHGTMLNSVSYFESIGFSCPDDFTPTDYYMALLDDEETTGKLIAAWEQHMLTSPREILITPVNERLPAEAPPTPEATKEYLSAYARLFGSSAKTQFGELMHRNLRNVYRNYGYIAAFFAQSMFFSILTAVVFFNLKDDVQGVYDRQGSLSMIASNAGMSAAMIAVNTFPAERVVFLREQQCRSYSIALYFIAKALAELPMHIVASVLQSIVLYFPLGLKLEFGRYIAFLLVLFLGMEAGTGVGFAVSILSPTFELATGFVPVVMLPMLLGGGMIASTSRLRPYWYWMEKSSMVRYAYLLLMKNELEPLKSIACDVQKYGATFCSHQYKTGKEVLHVYEYDDSQDEAWVMWLSIALFVVVLRVVCIGGLYQIVKRKQTG